VGFFRREGGAQSVSKINEARRLNLSRKTTREKKRWLINVPKEKEKEGGAVLGDEKKTWGGNGKGTARSRQNEKRGRKQRLIPFDVRKRWKYPEDVTRGGGIWTSKGTAGE